MRVFQPSTPSEFEGRNRLLQAALRPEPAPFAIEREYPIVLGAAGQRFSYCLGDEKVVVAHANLWPRVLMDKVRGREYKIGLVGNVATAERYRGQGVMRALLEELKGEAERLELKALVLWSDLPEFYQKLGFSSFGRERRYRLVAARLKAAGLDPAPFARVPTKAAPALAESMLVGRYPLGSTLARSVSEFQALLAIPALDVFVAQGPDKQVQGYGLLGKGIDMIGVIHEWGAASPEALLAAACAAAATGFDDITVLAPGDLPAAWHEPLSRHAEDVAACPLGLAWSGGNAAVQEALERSFIWGLDSI